MKTAAKHSNKLIHHPLSLFVNCLMVSIRNKMATIRKMYKNILCEIILVYFELFNCPDNFWVFMILKSLLKSTPIPVRVPSGEVNTNDFSV
jgi:hypothetical protein